MEKGKKIVLVTSIFVIGLISGLILTTPLHIAPKLKSESSANPMPLVNEQGRSPFTKVAKQAMPAVVNISTEHIVKVKGGQFFMPFGDDFFKKFFGDNGPQFKVPEREYKQGSLGSGFIFKKEGNHYFILTNNHVVRNADKIVVKLSDKSVVKGKNVKVVGKDPNTDVAVVRITTDKDLPILPLGNSDSIDVGDWAIAIGNPFGLNRTLTVGVISAKGRSGIPLPGGPVYQEFIQTDAAINPGNSGGPLLNIRGEVIGINSAITTPSGGFVGIGFAVPINTAKWVANQLMTKGKVMRGYLGILPQPVSEALAKAYNLPKPEGVLIAKVEPKTPAKKAGLKEGDIIIKFNGQPVEDVESFRLLVAELHPGTEVPIVVVRQNGKRVNLKAKLSEYPSKQQASAPSSENKEEVKQGESEWAGLVVVDARSDEAKSLGVSEKGVLVTKVKPESAADDAGFAKGDVIKKIGSIDVYGLETFEKAKKTYKNSKKPVVVKIMRRGAPWFIGFVPSAGK